MLDRAPDPAYRAAMPAKAPENNPATAHMTKMILPLGNSAQ